MLMADRLTLDTPRRTADGYMAVRARAARTGVYQYSGQEVDPDNQHGLRDEASVNVLRDEQAVFDERSVRSFIGKPITTDHPKEAVTASNWKKYADGVIMGAVRDGDHLAFDLLLMDSQAIADTENGRSELSNGYDAKLEFGDFTGPDGTRCKARQDAIFGNHIARVRQGRAGATCRIGDAALCDTMPSSFLDSLKTEKPVKTMLIDGLTVDIANADTAEATIKTIMTARDAVTGKVTALEAKTVADAATLVAKDAEIAKLTADLAAAKLTPAQMRDAGKAYALVVGKAKASGIAVTDEMDEGAIMKTVIDKAMPGNTYTGDHVAIAFEALTKDVKIEARDALRDAVASGVAPIGDARATYFEARDKQRAELSGAWKTPTKTAA